MLRGLVVGAAIPKILEGFNDGHDEECWGEGKLKRISVPVTDIPHLPQSHEMRNLRTKEKEWEKKYYNVHECIRIPRTTHPNHTSRVIWARGVKCRGLFFQSTMDQIQHLSDPPGVQSPTTLVIHGRRNMRKNDPKAIHRAQSPKEERKAQPICLSNSSLPHKGILK